MEITLSGDVVVRARGLKAVSMALLGIAITALAIWLLGARTSTTKPLWFLHSVAVFGTLFFGAATLSRLYAMIRPMPALVVDREGIVDRVGWTAVGRIRWTEIVGFRIVAVRMVSFLAIDVHDHAAFVARGNILQRVLRSLNTRRIGTPVSIGTVDLDIGPDELLAIVRRFFDQSKDGRVSPST
jgi:hypothetical protein